MYIFCLIGCNTVYCVTENFQQCFLSKYISVLTVDMQLMSSEIYTQFQHVYLSDYRLMTSEMCTQIQHVYLSDYSLMLFRNLLSDVCRTRTVESSSILC